MRVNGQNIRADLVGYNGKTRNFLVVEVKTGQYARLTTNQRRSGVFSAKNSTINEKAILMRGRATDQLEYTMAEAFGLRGIGSGTTIHSNFAMKHYIKPGGIFKP